MGGVRFGGFVHVPASACGCARALFNHDCGAATRASCTPPVPAAATAGCGKAADTGQPQRSMHGWGKLGAQMSASDANASMGTVEYILVAARVLGRPHCHGRTYNLVFYNLINCVFSATAFADGHTASNAPDLFRPPKLSGAGPG